MKHVLILAAIIEAATGLALLEKVFQYRLVSACGGAPPVEQVLSPLVLHTTTEHEELKAIAKDCLTRHHAHHYLGFAETQWKLFQKENPPRVKPLLYVYRVLLTGIHLMRTGVVEANLVRLNEQAKLPYIPELIERKQTGSEKERLTEVDCEFHQGEYERLRGELQQSFESSSPSRNSSWCRGVERTSCAFAAERNGRRWRTRVSTRGGIR